LKRLGEEVEGVVAIEEHIAGLKIEQYVAV
jgi:hypothetical protein